MSDTKRDSDEWEPVAPEDLKGGDVVRVQSKKGTVWIPGVVDSSAPPGTFVNVSLDGSGFSNSLYAVDWYFDRAVPERVLPTVPGLYVSAARNNPGRDPVYIFGTGWLTDSGDIGGWDVIDERDLPTDLVLLVPHADAFNAGVSAVMEWLRTKPMGAYNWYSWPGTYALRTQIALDFGLEAPVE